MKLLKTLVTAVVVSASVLVLSVSSLAALTRHSILNQYDWASNKGIVVEFINDQAKDDAIAPLKTCNISINVGDGTKWYGTWYPAPKWEMGKEYSAKFILTPDKGEFWLDGKKKATTKLKYTPMEIAPVANGVPDWATGATAYKILIKTLKVTSKTGNDWEAELDPASFETNQRPLTIKDWSLGEDDVEFTVEWTFSFAPAE